MQAHGWLSEADFTRAVEALPLVSVDWVVLNPAGQMLLGLRRRSPARDWWFTPGGRVRKNEALPDALARVGRDELGLPEDLVAGARLLGAWDHFYPDSGYSDVVSTHYVNLPYLVRLGHSPEPRHAAHRPAPPVALAGRCGGRGGRRRAPLRAGVRADRL